jgi:hypothetical protein
MKSIIDQLQDTIRAEEVKNSNEIILKEYEQLLVWSKNLNTLSLWQTR